VQIADEQIDCSESGPVAASSGTPDKAEQLKREMPETADQTTPQPKKRGRPKGSKNKPCLITTPQQLMDLKSQYPENSPIWSGMPDCKQTQIAAVLSGLNYKLFRQSPSFTV